MRPDTYHAAITVSPTTTPPIQFQRSARKSLPKKANTNSATPMSAAAMLAALPDNPISDGKSCVVGKVTATLSRAHTRNTPRMPRSVNHAKMPITKIVTSARRLPEPTRISVLLPQPDASVMPNPNASPPTMCDSQMSFGAI